jgi:hypothetical protein
MKKNIALFTILCVSTLAFLPGCLGKKEVVKTEKVKKVTRSKELIED